MRTSSRHHPPGLRPSLPPCRGQGAARRPRRHGRALTPLGLSHAGAHRRVEPAAAAQQTEAIKLNPLYHRALHTHIAHAWHATVSRRTDKRLLRSYTTSGTTNSTVQRYRTDRIRPISAERLYTARAGTTASRQQLADQRLKRQRSSSASLGFRRVLAFLSGVWLWDG